MLENKRVYLIAISGTGMSALAGLLKQKGCSVSGSDIACYPPVSELLENWRIEIDLGYHVDHLVDFRPDYVVIGNFVRRDNPQAQYVLENNIPYGSLPSTLENYFLQKTNNLVVAGTHGKSTTSTLLAHLLESAGRDPSFFVGAVSLNHGASSKLGSGMEFVLEGDEYDTAFFDKESKFLHYRPRTGIWTSLEFDHADIFKSLENIEKMFEKFVQLIPADGYLVYCRDYDRIHQLVAGVWKDKIKAKVLSYGFHSESDYQIREYEASSAGMRFSCLDIPFESQMSGQFNAQNFSAAAIVGHLCGLSAEELRRGVSGFRGLKRRQEVRAERNGSRVIDDFAHHPTAVHQVLDGIRSRYLKDRIIVFFEPRSNTTRRSIFQNDFVKAFSSADFVVLPQVFKPEALPENDRLDVTRLIHDLNSAGVESFGPMTTEEMIEKAAALLKSGPCTFVVLSNGSFNGLHQKLISLVESQ